MRRLAGARAARVHSPGATPATSGRPAGPSTAAAAAVPGRPAAPGSQTCGDREGVGEGRGWQRAGRRGGQARRSFCEGGPCVPAGLGRRAWAWAGWRVRGQRSGHLPQVEGAICGRGAECVPVRLARPQPTRVPSVRHVTHARTPFCCCSNTQAGHVTHARTPFCCCGNAQAGHVTHARTPFCCCSNTQAGHVTHARTPFCCCGNTQAGHVTHARTPFCRCGNAQAGHVTHARTPFCCCGNAQAGHVTHARTPFCCCANAQKSPAGSSAPVFLSTQGRQGGGRGSLQAWAGSGRHSEQHGPSPGPPWCMDGHTAGSTVQGLNSKPQHNLPAASSALTTCVCVCVHVLECMYICMCLCENARVCTH